MVETEPIRLVIVDGAKGPMTPVEIGLDSGALRVLKGRPLEH